MLVKLYDFECDYALLKKLSEEGIVVRRALYRKAQGAGICPRLPRMLGERMRRRIFTRPYFLLHRGIRGRDCRLRLR